MPDLTWPASGRRWAAPLIGCLLAASACAGVPDGGPAQLGRAVPAAGALSEANVQLQPAPPQPGQSPTGLVRDFLAASADPAEDYRVARRYLSPLAARGWDVDAGAAVYDLAGLSVQPVAIRQPGQAVVRVRAPLLAVLRPDGSYLQRTGSIDVRIQLTRVAGQWRIARPPGSLLLSVNDFESFYSSADVYFLARRGSVLVPDERYFNAPPSGLGTALVRALLAGPSSWLRPAVHTAIPAGAQLAANVPVLSNGVAEVDLTRFRLPGPTGRLRMAAQLVWTLRQLAQVSAVRITVGGMPLAVPGLQEPLPVPDSQPVGRSAWSSYDPNGPQPNAFFFLARSRVRREPVRPSPTGQQLPPRSLRPTGPAGPVGAPVSGATALAVDATGRRLAVVTPRAAGVALLSGRLRGGWHRVATAHAMTGPSWDAAGELFTVASYQNRPQQLLCYAGGKLRRVAAAALLRMGPVTALQVGLDGTRLVALVGGPGGNRLVVGLLRQSAGRLSVTSPRVLSVGGDPSAATWYGADTFAVLAGVGEAAPAPLYVSQDGSAVNPGPGGLPAAPTALTGAPNVPLLAVSGGAVWASISGAWQQVSSGAAVAYPA